MSCLFNSLSYFVGLDSPSIRARICDWLATDPLLIDDMSASAVVMMESGMELGPYVEKMRWCGTWGGAIEIRAFVQIWRRPVHVKVVGTGRWIEFSCEEGEICRLEWTGGHYEPVRT